MSISSTTSTAAGATTQWKYDVFVNFRGGDIRRTFLSYLHDALLRANLKTFIDEDLRRGQDTSALLEAIEDSNVAVPIFSKDYASSPWCLDELVKIIESRKYRGQTVIPVFYDVRASVVQAQSETYAEAFTKHQNDPTNARRVPIWKGAMTKAAKISGLSAQNARNDVELVYKIVNEILTILGRKSDGMDRTGKIEVSKNGESVSIPNQQPPREHPKSRNGENSHLQEDPAQLTPPKTKPKESPIIVTPSKEKGDGNDSSGLDPAPVSPRTYMSISHLTL